MYISETHYTCPGAHAASCAYRCTVLVMCHILRGAQLSFRKFCGANRTIFGIGEILEDFVGFGTIWEDLGGFGPWRAPGTPPEGPWDAPEGPLEGP